MRLRVLSTTRAFGVARIDGIAPDSLSFTSRARPRNDRRVMNGHVGGGARRRLCAHKVHEGARRPLGAHLLRPVMRRVRVVRQPRERVRQRALHLLDPPWRDGAQDTVERWDVLAPHLSRSHAVSRNLTLFTLRPAVSRTSPTCSVY